MKVFKSKQALNQLEKRKGGYYYLKIDKETVEQFERKKATRLLCTLDNELQYRCGLNHYGDGHFYVIIASRYIKKLNKEVGEEVEFTLEVDPDQLGVDVPEILPVLLEQEPVLKEVYDTFTDGRKRTLIYSIQRVKDLDKQIHLIREFILKEKAKRQKS